VIVSSGGSAEVTVSANNEENGGNGNQNPGGSAITNGLVAYYTFDDGTADDLSELEFHANLINAPDFITDTPNGQGKALFLKATAKQFMNIPVVPFGDQQKFSVSLWLKDFREGLIFTGISSSKYKTDNYPQLYCINGKFEFLAGDTFTDFSPFSYGVSPIQDGEWHLVSITTILENYEWTMKLYVDGKLVDTLTQYSYNSLKVSKIQIGGDGDGRINNAIATNMKVDNIRFYDRVLDAADVKAIYEAEK
jgi:hypothetical protein